MPIDTGNQTVVWQWVGTLGAGLLVAVVSAYVTVHLSIRRFHSERWWERRIEAYSRLIDVLYQSKQDLDAELADAMGESRIDAGRKAELIRQGAAARNEVDRSIEIGAFFLSEDAHQRLKLYRDEVKQAAADADAYSDYLERMVVATDNCLSDFIDHAKRDLKAPD